MATVYGVGTANFIFLPVAAKLRARMRDAVLIKEMVLEGVSGIAQGMNSDADPREAGIVLSAAAGFQE